MPKIGQPFTLGEWSVKPGKESEFIEVWNSFAKWTGESQVGAGVGHLLQDLRNTRSFLSFGSWENVEAIDNWRQKAEFQDFIEKMRDLCDSVKPRTLKLISLVPGDK